MAIKIVQNVNRISATTSAVSSDPISLKSGYLRISTGATSVYVETGGNPTATVNSFEISSFTSEVVKERIARQKISGITTGSTTLVSFGENAGNPFLLGDLVTIQGAEPAGINTVHSAITSISDNSLVLTFNSSSIVGVITTTNASLARSVKVSAITASGSQNVSVTEVVQLVTE
jgi:hypothetical protein